MSKTKLTQCIICGEEIVVLESTENPECMGCVNRQLDDLGIDATEACEKVIDAARKVRCLKDDSEVDDGNS